MSHGGMRRCDWIILFSLSLSLTSCDFLDRLFLKCDSVITTSAGKLIGHNDQGSCSWKGVPYAEPPVGALRWKPPVPKISTQTLTAKNFASECYQRGEGEDQGASGLWEGSQSEDCLYLNIWSPHLPQAEKQLPVMVWIHGGGYQNGAGSLPVYAGDYLAREKDVVVVSINYRLGVFGFLASEEGLNEDPNQPTTGNYGALDQIEALRWVKQNISRFGGDPDRVTIFGESAGGWSTCSLAASPLASGLFERVIVQSGGCKAVFTLEQGLDHYRKMIGQFPDCDDEHSLDCMRTVSPQELLAAIQAVKEEEQILSDFFIPHLDGYFLEKRPLEYIENGEINGRQFLGGHNKNEFDSTIYAALVEIFGEPPAQETAITYNGAMVGIADQLFGMNETDQETFVLNYPFAPGPEGETFTDVYSAVSRAFSDAVISCPTYLGMEAFASFYPEDTYFYRFDFSDIRPVLSDMAAAHAMEIPFVFGTFGINPVNLMFNVFQRISAASLSNAMADYWTQFAVSGIPASAKNPVWPTFYEEENSNEGRATGLSLDHPIGSLKITSLFDQRCRFWSDYEENYQNVLDIFVTGSNDARKTFEKIMRE